MKNIQSLILFTVLVLWSVAGQAVSVKTTLFTFTLDNGKTFQLPFQHEVYGDLTAGMKDQVKSLLETHALSMMTAKLKVEDGFGKAAKMGEVIMHHMVQAAGEHLKSGGEAMIDAANKILDPKNTETLFAFKSSEEGGRIPSKMDVTYKPKIVFKGPLAAPEADLPK